LISTPWIRLAKMAPGESFSGEVSMVLDKGDGLTFGSVKGVPQSPQNGLDAEFSERNFEHFMAEFPTLCLGPGYFFPRRVVNPLNSRTSSLKNGPDIM